MGFDLRVALPYIVLIVVFVLLARRIKRPRLLRPSLLWVFPALMIAMALWYAWMAFQYGPHLTLFDEMTIVAAAIAGVGMGVVRANTVKLEVKEGKIQATLTLWGLWFLVVWMVGRTMLRQMGYAGASTPYGLFTDAFLALAVSSICARSVILARRCRALLSGSTTQQG